MLQYHFYADQARLDSTLAQLIADTITQAIAQRGQASIALSGGKTPTGMLQRLRQYPLAWEKVLITLADERWVEETHRDSNARFLQTTLLQGPARAAIFLPLKNAALTPHEGQTQCEKVLAQLPNALDLIVLGMGDDGHTASLFPHAPELNVAMHALTRSAAISPQTAPYLRMTLTAPYIAQSRHVILHITGASKKQRLDSALAADAPMPHLPIRTLLDLIQTKKQVFWTDEVF